MRNRNARVTGVVAYAAGTPVAVAVGFLLAGLIGGAIPVNAGWRPPPATSTGPSTGEVTIWVESNGIHTGLIVPKQAAGVDWRRLADPAHLADPRYGGHDHLAFGWGERDFYLNTPRWSDLRPSLVVAAATGSTRTLVHVDHVARPRPGEGPRPIVLSPDQYRRMARFVAASIAANPRRHPGYFAYDVFYEGRGRYSAITTCNSWVGHALARAGVRIGAWTPFPWTVMWWF